ncbi:hypothetical protein NZD89_28005 (plasmid) [Alicyclobacillus fastidiosus]|uniref:Type II secretion system protein GspF domain-containing protein n=1 Tax=Alicyclobacillus fastidiosus TaxID=392011 RepID=A0ABY6ZS29_9BACL|nr:hypothetical protein [Alicyclobacillus fastidiosus]WAH44894.1 hypothetical protein NZD89_28005 [Alicyclobacillus fastidiosus]GMA65653.1 hypothetical protein GCM10025859_60930 [Alicyclobacillus fastidiosus]
MDYIGYLMVAVGTVTSATIFFYTVQSEYQRAKFRTRIASSWNVARHRTRERLNDEKLDSLLLQAGFSFRAPVYSYFRLLFTALLLVTGILRCMLDHDTMFILLPVLSWVALEYRRPFPMYYGFQAFQKAAALKRNRSLYLLYRLVYQEILAFQDAPRSVNDMLERQIPRVPELRIFLTKLLNNWVDQPLEALRVFGDEIGTKQSVLFAQMLSDIVQGGPQIAIDIFKKNQEGFRTDRVETFKAMKKNRALLGTALTLIGFTVVSYDINMVIQIYSQYLMQSSMS